MRENNKVVMVFSTARRFHLFEKTIKSFIKFNPNIIDHIDKIFILDDRSTWEDRNKMEELCSLVLLYPVIISFNNIIWVDKLNFLKNISIDHKFILFLEDDWESISPLNIEDDIKFLNNNDDIDIITYNSNLNIQNLDNPINDDYCSGLDYDNYWKNPFPNYFKHITGTSFGYLLWTLVKIDNFSLNPGLMRSNIFEKRKFINDKDFEIKFAEGLKLKQLFVNHGNFTHIGSNDSYRKEEN